VENLKAMGGGGGAKRRSEPGGRSEERAAARRSRGGARPQGEARMPSRSGPQKQKQKQRRKCEMWMSWKCRKCRAGNGASAPFSELRVFGWRSKSRSTFLLWHFAYQLIGIFQ